MSYEFFTTGSWMENLGSSFVNASSTPFSIIAWVKPLTTISAAGAVIQAHATDTDYYVLGHDVSGYARATTRATSSSHAVSTGALVNGEWALISGTYAASNASRRAGLNGGDYVEESTTRAPAGTFGKMYIGLRAGPFDGFVGRVGLVAVYNKVLSDAEITALRSAWPEDAASYSDCIHYWNLRPDAGGGTINATVGGIALSKTSEVTYNADNPTLFSATTKKLKILVHPDAASATCIEGIVWSASAASLATRLASSPARHLKPRPRAAGMRSVRYSRFRSRILAAARCLWMTWCRASSAMRPSRQG
jgi:hypothetical protein